MEGETSPGEILVVKLILLIAYVPGGIIPKHFDVTDLYWHARLQVCEREHVLQATTVDSEVDQRVPGLIFVLLLTRLLAFLSIMVSHQRHLMIPIPLAGVLQTIE